MEEYECDEEMSEVGTVNGRKVRKKWKGEWR
jgi:hypothetical protein